MTAQQLVQLLTNATFLLAFVAVVVRAARKPSRESVDVALFFGAPAISITQGWVLQALGLPPNPTISLISGALVLAMPLLTLRAIRSFTRVRPLVIPAAAIGWVIIAAIFVSGPTPMPREVLLPILVYFGGFEAYAAVAIFRATPRARGVTRRRLQLVATGTLLLALVILAAGVAALLPGTGVLLQPLALASALAYLVGFAPPAALRRAWQAPEVFAFVRQTSRLVGEASPELVNITLARGTAAALGASEAAVCLIAPDDPMIHVYPARAKPFDREVDAPGRAVAYKEQRPAITYDDQRGPHKMASQITSQGLRFTLQAPITAGAQRFGMLVAFGERRSIFLEDDLALLQLLADQAAVILAHRRLYEEAKSLNRSLERNVSELRALNDELGAFAYSVSHDLRAPLRSIDGFSQILLEDKSQALGDDGRQHLERVRAAATRMGSLIDDMLLLSRLTRDEMNVENVDVTELARAVLDELRVREPQRSVEFESNGAAPAKGDARLLRIALTNLLGNAWKFTRQRNPAHISFSGETREGEAVFFVKDDGVGFDMRYADKLFGAFQRLHNTTEFEGTGIGLATVQRIVHRHGGRVWAESVVGKGTTIYFTLPSADMATADEDSSLAPRRAP